MCFNHEQRLNFWNLQSDKIVGTTRSNVGKLIAKQNLQFYFKSVYQIELYDTWYLAVPVFTQHAFCIKILFIRNLELEFFVGYNR